MCKKKKKKKKKPTGRGRGRPRGRSGMDNSNEIMSIRMKGRVRYQKGTWKEVD